MARYRAAKTRLCRREGEQLFHRADRTSTSKTRAFDKRPYPPGQHGQNRTKISTYGTQLREKQKAKRIYGVLERQFRRYYFLAVRLRGVTGTLLLQLLEQRLDNVVYRLGIGSTRCAARQIVTHGRVTVNGKRVNIPSYRVKPGEEISITEKARTNVDIKASLDSMNAVGRLGWVEWNPETFVGKVLSIPNREDIPENIREQAIIELYSK